jgi:uncharacterized protein YqjF (DUF2071 family)
MPTAIVPSLTARLAERQRPDGAGVLLQRWEQLLFLHWRYDPALIQRSVPAGLTVDTFDGAAWVGLVPVFMRNVRPRFVPPVPYVSNFLELNLRTYVYDEAGQPGVYFYSLDCDQPVVVEAARRLLHLRYEHAAMRGEVGAQGRVELQAQRVGQTVEDRLVYRFKDDPAVEALAGSLEFFLIERYRLFAAQGRDLMSIRVHHAPYRLRTAEVQDWSAQVIELAGLPAPARSPDHVCAAEPVDLETFLPERIPRVTGAT